MGFITSATLALNKYPAFLIEAQYVDLRVEPDDGADRVGSLQLGDLAVADLDILADWPWVRVPAGSRVREEADTDRLVSLLEDAWLRVAKRGEEVHDIATRCPEGSAALHLCICRCQHYSVVYDQVIIREAPDLTSKPVGKVTKGDLLCTGSSSSSRPGVPRARDDKWVSFASDSELWKATAFNHASKQLLPKGTLTASILKDHPEFGKLLQPVTRTSDLDSKAHHAVSGDPAGESETTGSSATKAEEEDAWLQRWPSKWLRIRKVDLFGGEKNKYTKEELLERNEAAVRSILTPEAQTEERPDPDRDLNSKVWLAVTSQNTGVWSQDDANSDHLMDLHAFDAVVSVHGPLTPAITSQPQAPPCTWLMLRTGDMILRNGQVVATVTEKPVFVRTCLEDGTEQLRPWDMGNQVRIQTISGFGFPWAVRHKSVPVRNEKSTTSLPLGLACRNDIVGVQAERGEWVQLTAWSDSRNREGGHIRPTRDFRGYSNCSSVDKASLWMLTAHKTIGTLLERLPGDEPCSLSTEDILLSCTRRGIYQRVTEICHRRIWKDNVDDLWEGEAQKLPPVETVEAKLFRADVDVLHGRKGGEFKGGAIVEGFEIPVQQEKDKPTWTGVRRSLEATAPLKTSKSETWEIRRSVARLGYVHYCATEPSSGIGKELWKEIRRLASSKQYLIVACHSILRQGTVDFWRSVGMKRLTPEDDEDRQLFKSQVNVRSQGSLSLEVEDLVQALPKSALPLFFWENAPALEAWNQSTEDPETEAEAEAEAKTAVDRKLRRDLLKMRQHLRAREKSAANSSR